MYIHIYIYTYNMSMYIVLIYIYIYILIQSTCILDISSIHNALRIFINVACLRFPVDILQSLRSRLSE